MKEQHGETKVIYPMYLPTPVYARTGACGNNGGSIYGNSCRYVSGMQMKQILVKDVAILRKKGQPLDEKPG